MNGFTRFPPIALSLALASITAMAQETATLEEVIVTAQKRTESLQDVPISVSAVGGEKIAQAGIENLQDLSAYVPNLKIVEGGLVPQMYIRGIGSGPNQGFEQSVGTYADGVYMGRSLQSRSSFMDLERVEVLRGPQSILFGQSSIAGAISLVSAKPTDEFEGMVSANHAPEYNETEINAYASGALTESLNARLALRGRQEDGYLENPTLDTEGPALDEQAARLTLDWQINDSLSALVKLETASIEREDGRPGQVTDLGDYPLTAIAQFLPLRDDAKLDLKQYSDTDNSMSFDSDNALIKLDYTFDNGLTLTSLTAYSEYEFSDDNYDGEASEVTLLSLDMQEEFEQFSQELRLTSAGGETIDYIAGLFYQTSEQRYREDAELFVTNLGLPLPANVVVERPFGQDADTYAAFAQATWNIDDQLRLTVGLRYTKDEKEGFRQQDSYTLDAIGPFPAGTNINDVVLVPGPSPLTYATVLGANFNLIDHRLDDDFNKTNWTPSINLQYDINGDIMVYASYTEGFKTGGFDARGVNAATATDNPFGFSPLALGGDNFQFDQETTETFELGAKMTLLDGTAELNAALFKTDYTDMQVSTFDGTFGFNVFNAGEASLQGLELDGRWQASANLLFSAGMSYLDFEWTDYAEAVCPPIGDAVPSSSGSGNCNLKGRENLQTPEWSASLSANHNMPVGDSFEINTTLDASFKDNHYTANDIDDRSEQGGATIFNMRLALIPVSNRWQLAIIGKNLADKRLINYNGSLSQGGLAGTDTDANGVADGGRVSQVNRPRTFAVEGIFRF